MSGPISSQQAFWDELRQRLNIETPAPVDRALGRKHIISRAGDTTTIEYDMSDFAETCVSAYLDLNPCKLKSALTPFLDESALPEAGWDDRGALRPVAARILMKCLWLSRLCRADLTHGITVLARRISCWSTNDDRRLYRLMCYISTTRHHRVKSTITGDGSDLEILCFADADHAGKVEHGYSISGGFVAVVGPGTFVPLTWLSKKQTACSRSTTEAETISLAHTVFSEALPLQDHLSSLLSRQVFLKCEQDNSSTIQVIKNGYSAKLRRCSKTREIDLTSLFDLFRCPDVLLEYCSTDQQAADVFTKCLDSVKFSRALAMVGICPPVQGQ